MTTCSAVPRRAVDHLLRAAVAAPSLHNSQPWLFTCAADDVVLSADVTRLLPVTDPTGREALISCGAALFNLRAAMRHLGFRPVVRSHPEPHRHPRLAQVSWGPYAPSTPEEELLHRAIRIRHTHRGPFQPDQVPPELIAALQEQARIEGAELITLPDAREQRDLAELIREAEAAQRCSPPHLAELSHWRRPFGSGREDGIPADSCPFHPDSTLFAGRDFTGLTRARPTAGPGMSWPSRTGLVALLSTPRDTPQDWLRAGQALQRVLLYAASRQVMAGFHTQPLEVPYLRAEVRALVPSRQFPQMILRLGYTRWRLATYRRPIAQVLRSRPQAYPSHTATPDGRVQEVRSRSKAERPLPTGRHGA
ncbi:hypothetical protein [Streptomyces sp. N35]|uniref:Acg family FMN-binding oxidoreductase n=1 Tax=Streptomyces sp. N35 TaxID=2795730 RepID=UPI0018F33E61|nr:hypothetical protein [Streptomyces sp. N35]